MTSYPSQYIIKVTYKDNTEHTYQVRKKPCKTKRGYEKQYKTVVNEAVEPQKPDSFERILVVPLYLD